MAARLGQAYRLFDKGIAPLVITVGGKRPGDGSIDGFGIRRISVLESKGTEALDSATGETDRSGK